MALPCQNMPQVKFQRAKIGEANVEKRFQPIWLVLEKLRREANLDRVFPNNIFRNPTRSSLCTSSAGDPLRRETTRPWRRESTSGYALGTLRRATARLAQPSN